MSDHKKYIGFGKIAVACLFLFNPFFGIIDILPDFIGLILLFTAISRMSPINGYFAEARMFLRKAMYLNIARFAFTVIIFANNFTTNGTFLLLYMFVFSVLDLIFLLPAISRIKQGLQYFPIYHPTPAIEAPIFGNSKITKTDFICGFTSFFTVFHAVLSLLPEFAVLFKPDDFADTSKLAISIYSHIGTFRLISLLSVTAVGIVWLVCISVYISGIRSDREFVRSLDFVYEEKGYGSDGATAEKVLKGGILLILLGMIFGFNFFVDDVNILPDFISVILFLCALSKIGNFTDKCKGTKILAFSCIALSLAKSVTEIIFTSEYSYTQIPRYAGAVKMYRILSIINIAESIIYLALTVCIFSVVKKIITDHTGFLTDGTKKDSVTERVKVLHKKLIAKSNVIVFFLFLRCASSVFYYISRVNYGWYFDLAFTYDIVINGICVALSAVLFKNISDEISSRYMISR